MNNHEPTFDEIASKIVKDFADLMKHDDGRMCDLKSRIVTELKWVADAPIREMRRIMGDPAHGVSIGPRTVTSEERFSQLLGGDCHPRKRMT